MDTLNYLMAGFGVALTPTNLMLALIGAFFGHNRRDAAWSWTD